MIDSVPQVHCKKRGLKCFPKVRYSDNPMQLIECHDDCFCINYRIVRLHLFRVSVSFAPLPGRPIVPTDKVRMSQNQPFYMSARQQDLSSRTLALAGLSSQDIDDIAADIAVADVDAACGMQPAGRSQNTSRRANRRFATLYPGNLSEHMTAMASALAAVPREPWMLRSNRGGDDDDDDEATDCAKRSSVVWLGRTGELNDASSCRNIPKFFIEICNN